MDIAIGIIALGFLIGGGLYVWSRRRPKMSGVFDPAAIERGVIPQAWLDALQDMERKVGDRVTQYYRTQEVSSPHALGKFDPPYVYTETWDKLVTQVQIEDALPNGALGEMNRTGQVRTLVLTKDRLNDLGHLQHELLHSLSWDHPELWDQCVKYPGDHWPVIFANLIGD